MSFFYGKSEPDKLGLNVMPDNGEEVDFFDAIPKAYRAQVRGKNTDTYEYLLSEQMAPVLDAIKDRSGIEFINPGNYQGASDTLGHNERARNNTINKILTHLKTNPELFPDFQDLSPEIIDRRIKDIANEEIELSKKTEQQLSVSGEFGNFIGGTGGVLVDNNFFELNLMSLGLNAVGRTIAQTIMRDVIVGAGYEAILQSGVKSWYEELGQEYGWGDFVGNVASGGIIGGAFPVAIKAGGKGVSLTNDQLRKGFIALQEAGYIKKKDADLLRDALDDAEIVAERPPSFVGDDAAQELKARIRKAIEAANRGDDAVAVASSVAPEKKTAAKPVALGDEPQAVGPAAGPRPDFVAVPKGRSFPDALKPLRKSEKKPKNLFQFIREQGGLTPNDKNIGDVKQYLDKSAFTVLNKKTGKQLDDMALMAQEAGYFPSRMDPYTDRVTVNDFLEAIERGGDTFSAYDDAQVLNIEKAQDLYDEAVSFGINPVGLTDDQFFEALAERRSLQESADRIPEYIGAEMTEAQMYAEMQIFDPEAHLARAEMATANLYAGRLPEVEGNPSIDIAAPRVPDIDSDSLTGVVDNWEALSNDIADDEIIYFDNDAGDPVEFSGAQIKQEINQDDSMLDRLRGCVIR